MHAFQFRLTTWFLLALCILCQPGCHSKNDEAQVTLLDDVSLVQTKTIVKVRQPVSPQSSTHESTHDAYMRRLGEAGFAMHQSATPEQEHHKSNRFSSSALENVSTSKTGRALENASTYDTGGVLEDVLADETGSALENASNNETGRALLNASPNKTGRALENASTNESIPFRCLYHDSGLYQNFCSPYWRGIYRDFLTQGRSTFGGTWPSAVCLLVECALIFVVALVSFLSRHPAFCLGRDKPKSRGSESPSETQEEAAWEIASEPRLLHHRFLSVAAQSPNSIAIIDKSIRLSFGDAQTAALQVVQLLVHSRGVVPCSRTPIGICADGSLFVLGILGIVQTGNPYVPFKSMPSAAQINFVLSDAKVDTVLVGSQLLIPGSVWEGRKESLSLELSSSSKICQTDWTVNENDLACILYTSGCTGKPKGVLVPHQCYHGRLMWMWQKFPCRTGEVAIHKALPICVDHVQEVFGYLGDAIPIVVVREHAQDDTSILMELCREHEVSRMLVVPSFLRIIVDAHREGFAEELPKLQLVISTSEALPVDLIKEFLSIAADATRLINTYGSTEIAGVTWAAFSADTPLPSDDDFAPIGQPLQGVRIHVLNPDMLTPVEVGSVGELFVESDSVAEGYLNRVEDDRLSFVKIPGRKSGWLFRTGDFGLLQGDQIRFQGRQDQQIKVDGQRVELLRVENALQNSLRICMAGVAMDMQPTPVPAVVVAGPSEGGCNLHAFLEASGFTAQVVDLPSVSKHMLNTLCPAHVPKAFWIEKALPRLANSSVDRKALQALVTNQVSSQTVSQPERFLTEQDSFGQMRYIKMQYADARRALGNMMTYTLFKVVCGNWLVPGFTQGAVPHSPVWLLWSMAEWVHSEDVAFLLGVTAVIDGMGGEERFRCSRKEPAMLVTWLFISLILGPGWIELASILVSGSSSRICEPHVMAHGQPLISVAICSFDPETPGFFLGDYFLARMIVNVWHGFTAETFRGQECLSHCLVVGITTCLTCLIRPSRFNFYVPVYLVAFYFGPGFVGRMNCASQALRGLPCYVRYLVAMVAVFCYGLGVCALNHAGVYPAWVDPRPAIPHINSLLLSALAAFPIAIVILLFFMMLPPWIDWQLSGPVGLAIFMLNTEFSVWVNTGVQLHELRVIPSLPDFVWTAGDFAQQLFWCCSNSEPLMAMIVGVAQLTAFIFPVVGFMLLIKWLASPVSAVLGTINRTNLWTVWRSIGDAIESGPNSMFK